MSITLPRIGGILTWYARSADTPASPAYDWDQALAAGNALIAMVDAPHSLTTTAYQAKLATWLDGDAALAAQVFNHLTTSGRIRCNEQDSTVYGGCIHQG